jgi:hypothetical protein
MTKAEKHEQNEAGQSHSLRCRDTVQINDGLILLCQINSQARHTRREAGIQCHGWQTQIHP